MELLEIAKLPTEENSAIHLNPLDNVAIARVPLSAGMKLRVVAGETYNALAAADAVIVSSGTATVEAALLDAPMVVVYRVSPLTAALGKPLVRTPYFAMVNLIAEKQVVSELVQDDFTPDKVAKETLRLLQEPNARAEVRAGLAEVRKRLGPPGAVKRAAEAIAVLVRAGSGNAS